MAFPFTTIGHCIYCDSTEPPLTREHVLPRGLGGHLAPTGHNDAFILQKAVCDRCREIIHKYETAYMDQTLALARARMGMSRSSRRKGTLRVPIRRQGSAYGFEDVQPDQLDSFLVVPHFREAKILTLQRGGTPVDQPTDVWIGDKRQRDSYDLDPNLVDYSIPCDFIGFSRMLCKIAHGILVAHLGPKGFKPLVLEAILSSDIDMNFYVGGDAPNDRSGSTMVPIHNLKFEQRDGFWIVDVHLFSRWGGPLNYVVAGEPL